MYPDAPTFAIEPVPAHGEHVSGPGPGRRLEPYEIVPAPSEGGGTDVCENTFDPVLLFRRRNVLSYVSSPWRGTRGGRRQPVALGWSGLGPVRRGIASLAEASD